MNTIVDFETVKYEEDDGIAVLTFNRPQAMNAHNYAMKAEMQAAAELAACNNDVRVLIVTGAGRGFHAGEDVKEVLLGGDIERLKADRLLALIGEKDENDWTAQVSPRYFYGYPKPTIAAVNGPAVGAGLSIAVSCDIRIAAPTGGFGYFFTRRGFMGPSRGLTTLIHLIGVSRTLELTLSGELMDAAEAARVGLISRVTPPGQLMDEARTLARKLMHGAPLAQRAIKATVYRSLFAPDGIEEFNARVESALTETEDHREGSAAFTEKRAAVWKSR
jgi:2-(1,2-epoxy-1,2-dihydrophenyl)acetyl-CoA isomerase